MKLTNNPFAAALGLTVASVTSIHAAPLYWKTSTAAAWTSPTWAIAPGGTYDQAWVSGSDVTFEDNLGTTLTISGPPAATNFASITANENVTVTPATTLGTGGTMAIVNVASGKTLDFAGQAIATAAGTGFIKNGPGTWVLSNGNAYPGGFTLNAGIVAVGNANSMGQGGALVINGGTIRSNGTAARNLGGKFASITLGGDVTLGDVTNYGALTFSNNTSLGAASRTLTVNSTVTHSGIISGGAGVGIVKTGPGLLTLSGANTYSGATTISGGVLSITTTTALPASGFSANGAYSVASGAGLAVGNAVTDANIATILGTTNFAAGSAIGFDTTAANRAYAVVLANTGQGSLGLVKEGANTLTLSTANTYTGGTTINLGGVTVSNASALGSGAVQLKGGSANTTLTVNGGLSVNNALTMKRGLGSRASLTLGSTSTGSTWSGNITVDNTNPTDNNYAFIGAAGTSTATASIVSGNIGYSVLGGVGSAASPSFVLRGGNFGKVTGSITLDNGYLQLLDGSKWEFSNASNSWGMLDLENAGAIVTVAAGNTLSSSGVVYSNDGGTLQLNNQAGDAAFSQTIAGLSGNAKVALLTGAATLTLNTTTDQASSGAISGDISLVKSGAAKQTLTGANAFNGSTTINGGTLAAGVIGTGNLTISSATLDLRKGGVTQVQTVNNLSLSSATLDIGLNSTGLDSIAANGTATVSGINTVKLHGRTEPGSYFLITTPAALSGNFALDTSDVALTGFPTSYSAAVSGNSYVLTVTGTATPFTAYWRGDVNSVWNASISAPNSNWATDNTGAADTGQIPGALTDVLFSATNATNTNTTLGADTSIYSLTFESGTATVGGANTLSILGANLSGNGVDVLSGANATLNTGALVSTSPSAVQTGGTLTVNGGGLGTGPLLVDGTLNANTDLTTGSLNGAGSISRSTAGTTALTVSGLATSTFPGSIANGSGTVSLNKTGTSPLTLSGANSYSGGTTINLGGVTVTNASAIGSGAVQVNGGTAAATLTVNGGLNMNNALTLKRGTASRALLVMGDSTTWSGNITVDNTNATNNNYAYIGSGGTTTATASIVSGNIGFSVLGTAPSATSPTFVLRSSNTFGKVTGSIALSTGFLQMLDTSRWEFGNTSNTWGTLDISNAGAIATVGAPNTLSSSGVVYSNVGGTLRLNDQAEATAYNQTIAGLGGNVNIGLLTGSATLTLNTTADQACSGVISGAVSLVKTGSAIQTLAGVNTYTGDTTVNGGTLILQDNAQLKFVPGANGVTNQLKGTGAVELSGDFNIDLSAASLTNGNSWTLVNVGSLSEAFLTAFQVVGFTETANVHTLVDGANTWTFTEATGILSLSTGGGFDSWASSKGLAGGDAAFDADPDHDGLNNGLEFVLGGEPNPANPGSNSAALLPTVSESTGALVYTFKRKDISESGAALKFQWSADLTFPSPANDVPVGAVDSTTDTIAVDVTEDAPDADTDTIVITIPAAKATSGKLFGRLSAAQAP
jgi:fibronectin-binding autotransporter adhesin